jgi:hypothetical protein
MEPIISNSMPWWPPGAVPLIHESALGLSNRNSDKDKKRGDQQNRRKDNQFLLVITEL